MPPLTVIPVLPPGLRPPPIDQQLSDLDWMYEALLSRSDRARRLSELSAPAALIDQERALACTAIERGMPPTVYVRALGLVRIDGAD